MLENPENQEPIMRHQPLKVEQLGHQLLRLGSQLKKKKKTLIG